MVDVERFVQELLTWQAVPYHHQGRVRAGVDCVGLALVALAEQDIVLDVPSNYHQTSAGLLLVTAIQSVNLLERVDVHDEPEQGDILVFRIRHQPQHLAVALSNERMIHTTQTEGVRVVTISPMWRGRLTDHYRWLK